MKQAPTQRPEPRRSAANPRRNHEPAFAGNAPLAAQQGLRSADEPLDAATRAQLEPRFGHDFSDVRVHRDPQAAASARALRAKAFTVGNDIVFAAGRFSPTTNPGRQLLAHELAHVVQQSRGGAAPALDTEASHEHSAGRAAEAIANGTGPVQVEGATGVGLARAAETDPIDEARKNLLKAKAAVDQLEQLSKTASPEAPLTTDKTVRAYDAINVAAQKARVSQDPALIAEADEMRSRFIAATKNTPAALPTSSQPHPLASQQPLTPQEAFVTNTAQRGFERVYDLEKRVASNEEKMQQLIEQRKNAPAAARAKIDEDIRERGEKLRNAREELALLSTPQLKNPRELREARDELNEELATKQSAYRKGLSEKRLEAKEREISAVQRAQDHPEVLAPLAAFRGVPLGEGEDYTYVTVELRTADGTLRRYQARNPGNNKEIHAEDVIMRQIEADGLLANNGLKGAKMVIHGDQEVCERCAKRLPAFGEANGLAEIEGITMHAPALTNKGTLAPNGETVKAKKATIESSDAEAVDKREQALRKAGELETDETLPLVPQKTFPWKNPNPPEESGHPPAETPSPQASNVPAVVPTPAAKLPTANTTPVENASAHPSEPTPATPQAEGEAPADPTAPAAKAKVAETSSKTQVTVEGGTSTAGPSTPAKPAMKTSMATSYGGGLASAPTQTGFKGNVGVETKQERANGIETGQKVGVGGNVNVDVQLIPGTYPAMYRVILTIDVNGSGSASAARQVEGKPGVSGGVFVSGSASLVYSHRLTAEQAERYRQAALSGTGQGDFAELKVAQAVAEQRYAEAQQLAAQNKSQPLLAEGDELTFTAQGHVGGELGGSAGRPGGASGSVSVGGSAGKKVRIHIAAIEGKEVYTVMVETEKGWTLGAAASYYAVGMGYTRHGAESDLQAVSFILDPKQADAYAALREELGTLSDFTEVQAFAARHPELAGSRTTGKTTAGGGNTSFTLLGTGLNLGNASAYSEESTVDPNGGVTKRYTGQGTLSASAGVGGSTLNKFERTDTFTATVGPDNKAAGETSSTRTETDYGRSLTQLGDQLANKPLSTIVGVASGGTKILQESTDTTGKKLTDESFAHLIKLAADPSDWGRPAMTGLDWNTGNYYAWMAIRQPILDASGDRHRVAKLLAEYEKGGSGRSTVVEYAVGSSGIRFEFPQKLAPQKVEYESLVVADPFARAHELEASGNAADALGALQDTANRLSRLQGTLESHREEFSSSPALAEMLRRLGDRQGETQAEIRRVQLALQRKSAQPDATKGRAGGPKNKFPAVTAPSVQEAPDASVRREERNQQLRSYITACLTLRDAENAAFDIVKDELDDFYVDLWKISRQLNRLQDETYPEWDKIIEKLRSIYQERGDDPARAKPFAPDRVQWFALHKKGFPR